MFIPEEVRFIIGKLKSRGYEAYAVGGCVRDGLIGKQPNDWDITTDALPEQMKECFGGMRLIETGLKHGTLTVMLKNVGYEVTTYRIDGEYSDHRRPDSVSFVKELSKDLERRDFTVNAMAVSENGEVTDLFHGQEDLNHRIIRCVGDPRKRFEEDALRILRALRFASVYDFEIENDTAQAALELKDTLVNVSAERIFTELKKLLCGKGVERILTEYPQILFTVFPELIAMYGCSQNNPHHAYDVWIHTVKAIAASPADPVYRLCMLFHDSGKPMKKVSGEDGFDHFKLHAIYSSEIAEKCLLRMKSDTLTLRRVCRMIKEHDLRIPETENAVKKQCIRLGTEEFMELFPVFRADSIAQNPKMTEKKLAHIDALQMICERLIRENVCLNLSGLAVNGNDLKQLGIRGPVIGRVLKSLLQEVALEGLENQKVTLMEKAKEYLEKDEDSEEK